MGQDPPEFWESRVGELGRAFAAALLSGDEVAAELVIREAMDADLPTAEIDDEIIAPAMWLVGELWQRGEISVAEEHMATEITTRVIALRGEAERLATQRTEHRVMLAAVAGELHVVALRMLDALMREAGYPVVMLGADVPPEAMADLAARNEPAVICLTATMPGGGDKALVAIHEVQAVWPHAGFLVGGRDVAPRLRARPGIAVCRRVSEAVEAVDALIKRADLN